jgi:hypothetical protein
MLLYLRKKGNFKNVIFVTGNIATCRFVFDDDDDDDDDDNLLEPIIQSLAQSLITK